MHCLSSNNIDINSENFLKKLQHLLDKHAPLKTSTKITFTKLSWIALIFEKKWIREIKVLEDFVKLKSLLSYLSSTIPLKRWKAT